MQITTKYLFQLSIVLYLISAVQSVRQLFKTDLSKNVQQDEANNWSETSIFNCHERSGNLLGPFTDEVVSRTITGLPTHWSVAVAIDIVALYNWQPEDKITLKIDGNNVFTKTPEMNPFDFCQTPPGSYTGDLNNVGQGTSFRIYKNITDHFAFNQVRIEVSSNLQAGETTKFWGIQDVEIFVDECDRFCQTCFGPTAFECLACPSNGFLSGKSCSCGLGYFNYDHQCLDACPDGFHGQELTKACEDDNFCDNVRNCIKCENEPYQCSECAPGYILYKYSNKCLKRCPFYAPVDGTGKYCIDPELEEDNIPKRIALEQFYDDEFGNDDMADQGWSFYDTSYGPEYKYEPIDDGEETYARKYSYFGGRKVGLGLGNLLRANPVVSPAFNIQEFMKVTSYKYNLVGFSHEKSDVSTIAPSHFYKVLRFKYYLIDLWNVKGKFMIRLTFGNEPVLPQLQDIVREYEIDLSVSAENEGKNIYTFGDEDIDGSVAFQPDFSEEVIIGLHYIYQDEISSFNFPYLTIDFLYSTSKRDPVDPNSADVTNLEQAIAITDMSVVLYTCPERCLTCLDSNTCLICIGKDVGNFPRIPENQCSCPPNSIDLYKSHGIFHCQLCQGPQEVPHARYNPPICQCPDGFYDDSVQDECQQCPDECLTCDRYGCHQCSDPNMIPYECKSTCEGSQGLESSRIIEGGECVCPENYYESPNQFVTECQRCPLNCDGCTGSSTCVQCSDPNMLLPDCQYPKTSIIDGQEAYSQGYFPYYQEQIIDGITLQAVNYLNCSNRCTTCDDEVTCTECNGDPYRQGIPDCFCMDGYHDNYGQLQECVKCHHNCLSCMTYEICLTCKADINMYLDPFTNKCVCKKGLKQKLVAGDDTYDCVPCYSIYGGCVEICPEGTVTNEVAKTCDVLTEEKQDAFVLMLVGAIFAVIAQVILFFCVVTTYKKNHQAVQEVQKSKIEERMRLKGEMDKYIASKKNEINGIDGEEGETLVTNKNGLDTTMNQMNTNNDGEDKNQQLQEVKELADETSQHYNSQQQREPVGEEEPQNQSNILNQTDVINDIASLLNQSKMSKGEESQQSQDVVDLVEGIVQKGEESEQRRNQEQEGGQTQDDVIKVIEEDGEDVEEEQQQDGNEEEEHGEEAQKKKSSKKGSKKGSKKASKKGSKAPSKATSKANSKKPSRSNSKAAPKKKKK